jgi:hypothetical protein
VDVFKVEQFFGEDVEVFLWTFFVEQFFGCELAVISGMFFVDVFKKVIFGDVFGWSNFCGAFFSGRFS